jgi:parvulin-like peptidyl-prolyl isomerase
LRDELLKRLRDNQPKLEEIPLDKVRSYYEAHRGEFREPERRRVSHIVLRDRAVAEEVLQKAKKATPAEWGELVERYSLDRGQSLDEDPNAPKPPPELAGDLGLVSAPGSDRGENPRISEPVRAAAFKLNDLGQVYDQLVADGGQFHIVRLMGKSGARDRTFVEADRAIRVQILQEMIDQSEKDLLAELKKTIPVEINEAALGQVKMPEPPP